MKPLAAVILVGAMLDLAGCARHVVVDRYAGRIDEPRSIATSSDAAWSVKREPASAASPVQGKSVSGSANNGDVVEKLRQLNDLHESGALTDEEFQRAKARLLE